MITAVIGAQYGSEGKGVVVHHLADQYNTHVRVGGPNAGHSFNHEGRVWKMQVLPCGWTNPEAQLVLGRGMLIDPERLLNEIHEVEDIYPDIRRRIHIDPKAGTLSRQHHMAEGGVEGRLHARIGSTGEGVGAARIARIQRDPTSFRLWEDTAKEYDLEDMLCPNTNEFILTQKGDTLLEGTQGSGLSLIHGPWPYVTSNDTNAAQMLADIGLPASVLDCVILVARTMPIRVAGASGPLKGETTWEEVSGRMGRPTEERTTVTRKVRRIGEWDDELFHSSLILNDPDHIALMFLDYLFPEVEGASQWDGLTKQAQVFVEEFEKKWEVAVSWLGTGGNPWTVVDRELSRQPAPSYSR